MILKSFHIFSRLLVVGMVAVFPAVSLAQTTMTQAKACQLYKDQYLSYAKSGGDMFYVTPYCTRKTLSPKEVEAALADTKRKIYSVEEATMILIPREAIKEVSAKDFIAQHEGHCVSADDGKVWQVTARGIRAFPDFATSNAMCSKVYDVSAEMLAAIGVEKEAFPSVHDNVTRKLQAKTPILKLKTNEVCAQLIEGHLYSHGHEYYQLGKQGKVCYLQKLTANQMASLMTKLKLTPVPLTQSQYISLDKSKAKEESKG